MKQKKNPKCRNSCRDKDKGALFSGLEKQQQPEEVDGLTCSPLEQGGLEMNRWGLW